MARLIVRLMEFELSDRFVVRAKLPEVWQFFSSVGNLAAITPAWMRFTVLTPNVVIDQNAIFDYTIRWMNIPVRWRTRIETWRPMEEFVDLQERGPYALWRHRHTFREVSDGVECADAVRYRLPFGPLGVVTHSLLVRQQLQGIFEYRRRIIGERLGWVREIEPVQIRGT